MTLTTPDTSPKRAIRIAVTSGKGGVGKTSLTIHLALAAARLGHRVGILDADFALGNVDVRLGLEPVQHLGSVLNGSSRLCDIAIDGPCGVRIIPAGSGARALTALDKAMWGRLAAIVDEASQDLDCLFFDTGTGISDNVLNVIGLADRAVVVTCMDPAAVVDAYALIKVISAVNPAKPIGVVVNATANADEGELVFEQMSAAAERFLGRSLGYEGHVPADHALRESGPFKTPCADRSSWSETDRCIRRIARRLLETHDGAGPWPAQPVGPAARDGARSWA